MLKRQLLDFRFIVTEQYGRDLFNKGRIMNAAFEFAEQQLRVNCVIFHDVDMFPQDDRNFYGCPEMPRHIGAFVNTLGYELWYNYIVGGALAVHVDHYITVNGYSNMFWAWGGEDDDMGLRILANNMTIERPHPVIGRMTMLKHIKRQKTAPVLV
uniref:Beta-1,4-galactosyltransferase n=1 Tax=Romanomermis culicivorax TaxID=13658 RepID=A0A915HZF2_ROMCU